MNCQSIFAKLDRLLEEIDSVQLDAVVCTESRLDPDVDNGEVVLHNCQVFWHDRHGDARGRVFIVVNDLLALLKFQIFSKIMKIFETLSTSSVSNSFTCAPSTVRLHLTRIIAVAWVQHS